MLDHVDIDSSVAVYVQIENHVRFAIASGRLKPGVQLPPVRELAERLGTNQNTVAKAYRELEILGLVYARRGTGVFINKDIEAKCREECHRRIVSRLHEVAAEAKAAGMTGKEVREVVEKSFATKTSLYGKTPAEMLALAKDPGAGRACP